MREVTNTVWNVFSSAISDKYMRACLDVASTRSSEQLMSQKGRGPASDRCLYFKLISALYVILFDLMSVNTIPWDVMNKDLINSNE